MSAAAFNAADPVPHLRQAAEPPAPPHEHDWGLNVVHFEDGATLAEMSCLSCGDVKFR